MARIDGFKRTNLRWKELMDEPQLIHGVTDHGRKQFALGDLEEFLV